MNPRTLSLLLLLTAALVAGSAPAQTRSAAPAGGGQSATAIATPIAATPSTDTVSTTTTAQASGSIPASASAPSSESITFSGPVTVNTTVVTDPDLGTSSVVQIDGKSIRATGDQTAAAYLNGCEAILTRPFAASDTIELTFTYFDDGAESYLRAKTGLLTLKLTYDTTTKQLTSATGTVSELVLPAEPAPAPTPTSPTPTSPTPTSPTPTAQ